MDYQQSVIDTFLSERIDQHQSPATSQTTVFFLAEQSASTSRIGKEKIVLYSFQYMATNIYVLTN
jgi:hypothetical protein